MVGSSRVQAWLSNTLSSDSMVWVFGGQFPSAVLVVSGSRLLGQQTLYAKLEVQSRATWASSFCEREKMQFSVAEQVFSRTEHAEVGRTKNVCVAVACLPVESVMVIVIENVPVSGKLNSCSMVVVVVDPVKVLSILLVSSRRFHSKENDCPLQASTAARAIIGCVANGPIPMSAISTPGWARGPHPILQQIAFSKFVFSQDSKCALLVSDVLTRQVSSVKQPVSALMLGPVAVASLNVQRASWISDCRQSGVGRSEASPSLSVCASAAPVSLKGVASQLLGS